MSSLLTLYAMFEIVFILILLYGHVEGLSPVYRFAEERNIPNGCILRCNHKPTKQEALDCIERCATSVQKRSVGEICDYEVSNIWSTDGITPRGIAMVCVEYKLGVSGGYESANVSWMVPQVQDLQNDTSKYADVKGFFLRWTTGAQLNEECRVFPNTTSYFILNSSHLNPAEMKCDIPLSLVVLILPLPTKGAADLQPYNCTHNFRTRECFHWDYDNVAPTYETVNKTTSSPETSQRNGGKKDPLEGSIVCGTTTCQYAVYISVSAVVVFLVVLVILFLMKKCPGGGGEPVVIPKSKDYCYVSYFAENGKTGDRTKTVLDHLMRSGLHTIAVNALHDKVDLRNFYDLGPRKFSELYRENARHVIVIVTKKYLELCDVNNNGELDGERRRVFEEIKYIDRAQLEPPAALVSFPGVPAAAQATNNDMPMAYANNYPRDERFIAVVLDSSCMFKLPTWMKAWPMYSWPKDEAALLQSIVPGLRNSRRCVANATRPRSPLCCC